MTNREAPRNSGHPPAGQVRTFFDTNAEMADSEDDVPAVVIRIRQHDKNLPALGPERLGHLFVAAEDALSLERWQTLGIDRDNLGIRELNLLSKAARECALDRGNPIGRKGLDYLLKSLLFTGNLRPGLKRQDLVDHFGAFLISRAAMFGCINDRMEDHESIVRWLEEA